MTSFFKTVSISWAVLITTVFMASFISEDAATFAVFTRYIYVIMLTACAASASLEIVRSLKLK